MGAVVSEHAADLGVTIHQATEGLVDDPDDLGLRPEGAERGEGREGVHDVPQRARLDDADFVRSEAG
jgi:hypothetical protein